MAAIVLYHMADYWLLENKSSYSSIECLHKKLISECSDFLLIRDIADASKHAELRSAAKIPRELSSSEQITRSPGLFESPFGEGLFSEAVIVFALMDDGGKEPIAPAIRSVKEMWENKIFSFAIYSNRKMC